MRKTLLTLLTLFIFTGCDSLDIINDNLSKSNAETQLNKLCKDSPELVVCTNVQKREYIESSIDDIFYYMEDQSRDGFGIYKSKDDVDDEYYYMIQDENNYRSGDCEDFVITFFEDLVNNGLIKKESLRWMFGTVNDSTHAWVLLNKDDKTYIFDTYKYWYGEEVSIAYSNDKYIEIGSIITY